MNIRILELSLRNFKKIASFTVNFDRVTMITGDNGVGKTTLFDAFMWLLFDKNSADEKDFNIKTLDRHNNAIHNLEHEVSGLIDVDGRHVHLKKIFKEKWTKKRGSATADFTGHETEYFIDDVPLKKSEYQARIDMILKEDIAKLVTNPLYFNEMKWTDRRKTLEAMAGDITNEFIAGANPDFIKLVQSLGNTSLFDQKRKIAAQKGKIKDAIDNIAPRMDEVDRSKPLPEDWEAIEKLIGLKQGDIGAIDLQIEGSTAQYAEELKKIREKQSVLSSLQMQLQQAEVKNKSSKATRLSELTGKINQVTNEIAGARSRIELAKAGINAAHSAIKSNNARIESLNANNDKIRGDWFNLNEETLTIDPSSITCPSCQQALPTADALKSKLELERNFNDAKAVKLKALKDAGQQNKQSIDDIGKQTELLMDRIETLEAQISDDEKQFTGLNAKIEELQQEIETIKGSDTPPSSEMVQLQEQIKNFVVPESPVIDNTQLKQDKAAITAEVDVLRIRLSKRSQIQQAEKRIYELQDEQRTLSQQLADLEKEEFTIEAFSKAKIETIESRINGKFKLAKWRMFTSQINGGETESCECIVGGVPHSDLNTGARINVGLDIINALTEHYNISAPIWVDNRETVTSLIPCASQIINLVALKGQPLTVTHQDTTDLNLILAESVIA